jgi:hypothetical protein
MSGTNALRIEVQNDVGTIGLITPRPPAVLALSTATPIPTAIARSGCFSMSAAIRPPGRLTSRRAICRR